MKHPILVTCTTTLLASAIAACLFPAHASDATPAAKTAQIADAASASNDSGSAAQTAPQTSSTSDNPAEARKRKEEQAKQANAVTLSTVNVSPLRSSLESAQSIKQNSRMVVDSVVAEDIGKLPDNTVADALQRVTGVQVAQGFKGETSSVVVRGLPNVVTTLNGRTIFGSDGRQFAFQDLPATAVSGLDVYKTTEASMVTGGIAGTVNVRTFRPFDFDGLKMGATLTGTHQKYGGHIDPTASFLISDRWNTDAGEFGALLNTSITTMHYDYNVAFVNNNVNKVLTDKSGKPIRDKDGSLLIGNNYGANYNIGWRKRPEANYALQWKPNANTEVYLEGLYTWLSESYTQYVHGGQPAASTTATLTNYTVNGGCFPIGLTNSPYYGQTVCPMSSARYTGNFYGFTSTQAHKVWGHNSQNALGLKWHDGRLALNTELSRTGSSYEDDNLVLDTFLDAYSSPLTMSYNAPNNFGFLGNPQLDPSRFYLNGLYQAWSNNKADQTAWRGDGNFDINGSFFSSLDFGLRYADTEVHASGAQLNKTPPGGAYVQSRPNPANNVVNRLGSGFFCNIPTDPAVPGGALSGCYDYLMNNADALRALYGLPNGKLAAQQGKYFDIAEKSYSGYAQMNYGNELFGLPFDGVFGVRLEKIKRNLNAYTFDSSASIYSPITLDTTENHVLPNATFNLHFSDTLQMRLSAGKTVQYPGFGQLNPSLTLSPPTQNVIARGSGGNAYLKPIKSNSYDATLEWYFSKSGSLTGGVFYHDITGYIETYSFEQNIGGIDYLISGPQSSGAGHLEGVELAYQQFFTFLPGPWDGFGVQANYTRINSSLKTPAIVGTGFITTSFQNVSKDNYNLVLMYEKYGFSARLAYNYRSRFPEFFLAATNLLGGNAQMYDKPANMLDLSLSYDINKNVAVVFNATNLTHAKFRSYAGPGQALPQDLRYQDSAVGLGVRLKL